MSRYFLRIRKIAWLSLALGSALLIPLQIFPFNAQSPTKVDRIVIEKSQHTMELMDGPHVVKSYKVALGGNPKGAKR